MSNEEVSFEQKLQSAKKVLEELSNPEITLADGMNKYKVGIALLEEASKMIENAKLEYETLQTKEEIK